MSLLLGDRAREGMSGEVRPPDRNGGRERGGPLDRLRDLIADVDAGVIGYAEYELNKGADALATHAAAALNVLQQQT